MLRAFTGDTVHYGVDFQWFPRTIKNQQKMRKNFQKWLEMYSWANPGDPWKFKIIGLAEKCQEDQAGPSPNRDLLPRWQLEWVCALLVAASNPYFPVCNDKPTGVQHPPRCQSSQCAPLHGACCTSRSPNVLLVAERAPSTCSHATEQASAQISLDNALGPDRNGGRHEVIPSSLFYLIFPGAKKVPIFNPMISCMYIISMWYQYRYIPKSRASPFKNQHQTKPAVNHL